MNYKETTDWLFKQLPMYQNQGESAYKANLDNIVILDEYLDFPHRNFKSIHVAGTNGKGSTSHMLASVFQEAGYKVGLYTSPHLKDFRERIKINGEVISECEVVDFVKVNRNFFEENNLSFFEMTVGMAFDYFSNQKVDIAIIEVGLGGRLDSTNIITPELSIITNISLDHTKFLGTTLESIAKEKSGIIKSNIPVVIGQADYKLRLVFNEVAKKNNAEIIFTEDFRFKNLESDLLGDYQVFNMKTVQTAFKILQESWDLKPVHLKEGLLKTVANTSLLGRWQKLSENPLVFCDTAHNEEGLKIVISQLKKFEYATLHIILGVVNDKDLNKLLPIFPKDAKYYFSKPNVPRGLNETELKNRAKHFQLLGNSYTSVSKALSASKLEAKKNDLIFIGGSTFTVAEII
ncbi:bifunctional folylpolyglutamate synthase/dihydrofolate synthase [Croceibacter atlanticus]|uniref:Dihydrofolate synthase/folylpolyglutamate synthase n=1 Tax=Croceibacter atlanticus (strain ATCC BAA-628 / JCM 21780 / CIP 108009 / IAM 15332 / KCTC 12090 / HTCC2559) TaxID=216432 RepID=A3U858_CROAH|nr:folylpolyglutamate synthase/dihydrofolate synthase family protein [Croceibacter atlanticus]EAP88425.1 putative folylpolyglutamate synthase [Croceibacter atlanticus HTCC2559]MBW4969441.1 bifunctional folylpolyglutamate synthase/dihydrofolate synthase [Croceibacter atlanticus]